MHFFSSEDLSLFSQVYFGFNYFIFFLLATHILFKKSDPTSCLGWLFAAAFSPPIALLAYIAFGLNPFENYKKRRSRSVAMASKYIKSSPLEIGEVTKAQFHSFKNQEFFNTLLWAAQAQGQPLLLGENVEMIVNSNAAYSAYEKAIREASEYILIEFYQIQNDRIGVYFLDLLAEKAQAGVRVYVLFDPIGSYGLHEDKLKVYRQKGVHIYSFLSIRPFRRRFQINWRNHRKIVVCDGKIGFVGGFNIGELYLVGKDLDNPHWVDVNFVTSGQLVDRMTQIFSEDWHFATGQTIRNLQVKYSLPFSPHEKSLSILIASGPSERFPGFHATLLSAIYESRKRIWFATPYFVPDRSLLEALAVACRRGVDVRIFIPKKSNHRFADFCSQSFFADLFKSGVKIYRFRGGMCHAKLMIGDEDLVLAGSSNLDNRSFFLNFEVDFIAKNENLQAELEKFFENAFAKSSILTKKEIRIFNPLKILTLRIARICAPLL